MAVLDTFSLTGKVSVVTGANRGIGRALSLALAEAGSDVVLLVRNLEAAASVLAEITELGVQAVAVAGDVTEPDSVAAAATEVMNQFGRVDVLVNNAGACIHRPALDVPDNEFNLVMNVNIAGSASVLAQSGRSSLTAAWSTPLEITELTSGVGEFSPMLSLDARTLYYDTQSSNQGDLFRVARATPSAAFGTPEPITELNEITALEGDPWVSADCRLIMFESNRDGGYALWTSSR